MDNDISIVRMEFADSKPPDIKEVVNKDWIYFGEKNNYPEYLLYQYKKCGKHRAIVNGKVNYIFGGGIEGVGGFADTEVDEKKIKAKSVNANGETMSDILKKSIKDIEVYGGFRWFVTVDKAGRVAAISHSGFGYFRKQKQASSFDKAGKEIKTDGGFYWSDKWFSSDGSQNFRCKPELFTEFTTGDNKPGVYVFSYNEYEPGVEFYPMPNYLGTANYIDIDIEISKFHLSAIRNGMMPSKMLQFFIGEPTDEKKSAIERRIKDKFGGSENAGKFFIVYNKKKEEEVKIDDLSNSELDKQFDMLSKTVQQEIFTGHQVVSPMLFGIKTEGQLGGSTELKIAYEIFMNTYGKPKQDDLIATINWFGEMMGMGNDYKFIQLDPIGLILDIKDFIALIPTDYILEKLGIPKKFIQPAIPDIPAAIAPEQLQVASPVQVNDNLKNLTGKQFQHVTRIIRNYSKGSITVEVAKTLLRTGYGLSEEDINSILGITDFEEVEMLQNISLMQHRIDDIDKAVRPVLRLNFITDKKILSKKVSYKVFDESGCEIKVYVPVAKIQTKIIERMKEIENHLNSLYA